MEEEDIALFVLDDGLHSEIVVLEKFLIENIVDIRRDVGSEISGDEDSALLVEDVQG